jgi:hypothetical protein
MLKFIGQLIWFSIEMLEFRIFVAYSVVLQIFVYTFVAKVGSPAARSEEENQSDEDSCLTTDIVEHIKESLGIPGIFRLDRRDLYVSGRYFFVF